MSDPLWPNGLQHARLPYPSISPWVCSNACPLSQESHPTISSSVTRFSSSPQSFPESGSFPMSCLFASGGQSIYLQLQHQSFQWIFRTDFLQDCLVWSPCCPSDSQESSPAPHCERISSFAPTLLYGPAPTRVHDTGKAIRLYGPCHTVISLLCNTLSRFVICLSYIIYWNITQP